MSNQNFTKKRKIIFVDNDTNFEELKNILKIDDTSILITFDYNSHNFLQKQNISHKLSENFLNDDDFESIQNQAYYFSNWAKQSQFQDLLTYKSVNVGNLFYIEFFVFILPIIKKLFEIKKISQVYDNYDYLASGIIFNISKIFLNDVLSFHNHQETKEKFVYDTVNFETSFLKIKLSTNYYNKIKKTSENFFQYFFSIDKTSSKNRVMLVEFNTIRYSSLFDNIHKHNLEPIYFGIRRPAIWNRESYSIIKNSHTKIVSNSVHDNNFQELVNLGISTMNKNYEYLLKQNFFKNYFQLENKSFWHIIAPHFNKLWQNRMKYSIHDIENSYRTLEITQPESILLLSESGYAEQIILCLAKKIGIKTFLLHHGMFHDTEKGNIWNKFSGSILTDSDKFFVWGNSMKKYSKHYGIPDSKVISVGSPAHDVLFNSKYDEIKTDEDTVLLIAQGPGINLHSRDYSIQAHEEYYNSIRTICKSVLQLNKKLIIKLHPYENISNEKQIADEISSKIIVTDKGDTLSLIKSCNVFVIIGTSLSTTILEAHAFTKPVIRVNFGEWMDKPDKLRALSCHSVDSSEFFEVLDKTIHVGEYRNQIISIGKKFLEDYLEYQGNSSNTIASYLFHDILDKLDSSK